MLSKLALPSVLVSCATCVAAGQFSSGDWSAAKIGNTCYVYTQRAQSHTSGTLIFGFTKGGYNATFQYEYTPWHGETEAPWSESDAVVLEVDGAEIWLGEEMFPRFWAGNYSAELTTGFVSEMLMTVSTTQSNIAVAFDQSATGEIVLFGNFSPIGFQESLARAAQWCEFEPTALPGS
ncbi:MAG: hypothetical protein ABJL72_11820 [Roseobacter sp.]